MATIIITEEQYDDFLSEEPTNPLMLLTVEKQINAATSVSAFTARAQELEQEYADVRQHWTERLENELDVVQVMDIGNGWAGMMAR